MKGRRAITAATIGGCSQVLTMRSDLKNLALDLKDTVTTSRRFVWELIVFFFFVSERLSMVDSLNHHVLPFCCCCCCCGCGCGCLELPPVLCKLISGVKHTCFNCTWDYESTTCFPTATFFRHVKTILVFLYSSFAWAFLKSHTSHIQASHENLKVPSSQPPLTACGVPFVELLSEEVMDYIRVDSRTKLRVSFSKGHRRPGIRSNLRGCFLKQDGVWVDGFWGWRPWFKNESHYGQIRTGNDQSQSLFHRYP